LFLVVYWKCGAAPLWRRYLCRYWDFHICWLCYFTVMADGISLAEAREKLIEARRMVSIVISISYENRDGKNKSSKEMTFGDYTDKWLSTLKIADSTMDMKLAIIAREITPTFANKLLREISTEQVLAHCEKIRDRGAPSTALQVREIMSSVFRFAHGIGVKILNPVDVIRASNIATFKPRERALSPEEIGILFKYMDKVGSIPTIKLAIKFILLTMVRKSELLHATWDEVSFEQATWTIPASRMKAGRSHVIYLSRQALDILVTFKMCASYSDYLLPSNNQSSQKTISQATLNRVLDAAVKLAQEAGERIEKVSVHDLRRTASTLLHETGFNSDWIEKCLAHEQRGVRAVYNKAEYAEQRRDMLQQWADMVDGWSKNSNADV
jgi:integrase